VRAIFVPPADEAAGLLSLPWDQPLDHWVEDRLVTPRHTGLHRHPVRFVEEAGVVWVIKELPEPLARREYRLLRHLGSVGIPSVTVQGAIVDRGPGLEAALVTRYLEYSSTYRALFSERRRLHSDDLLLDALVELLVRLHLAGFYWGDCSLSNALFRLDAGTLSAYLVDSETAELHPSLSEGQRMTDVYYACERVAGELDDLAAGGLLPVDVDPFEVATDLEVRYLRLWEELDEESLILTGHEREQVSARLQRLNDLGFDVYEVELTSVDAGHSKLRVTTRVSEPGHYRQLLYQRTGLVAQENQARRLLNDISAYRAGIERSTGRPMSESSAAAHWLTEIWDPVVASIPPELADRLDPVEVFHEVLEHRWFLSEEADHDVGTQAATDSYVSEVLPAIPDDLTTGTAKRPRARLVRAADGARPGVSSTRRRRGGRRRRRPGRPVDGRGTQPDSAA
jgi:Domain of unknown function (DUF4032)/Lipopolysaccharide kinase (Kdo/WaaP) family